MRRTICSTPCSGGTCKEIAGCLRTSYAHVEPTLRRTWVSPIRPRERLSGMASSSTPLDLHIANLLRLARGDLDDARSLRETGSRNAAYHAEQAAEKILLAILTSENVQVERKDHHRLDVLADLVPRENGRAIR